MNHIGDQHALSFCHSGAWLLIYKGITDTKKASCWHNQSKSSNNIAVDYIKQYDSAVIHLGQAI
ncbi:hypothetical protein MT378_17835, partial [Psychrobacter sp. 16-Bac2893]